ncbi:putative ubiquitin activating E1 enzyme [Trypanosoma conorhini]|uniref:Ubiquitin-like modifier-activating enzyme ATG7 n=1 Tax=Trypanosoma conorhini TaxID=83891 RepID=A0A422PGI5_9TRYP|nr:putative ubiquitin activating E1 enzyme [Trypanosoma conorhini]RNF16828.1 putative ubiquitin activating E1 enzyme [Trypanosoma conorhini]
MNATATAPAGSRLKFKEYSPHIEVSFWYELERRKLHEWRLQEPVVPLTLFCTVNAASSSAPANIVTVRRESLDKPAAIAAGNPQRPPTTLAAATPTTAPFSIPMFVGGELQNFNTFEQLCRLPRRETLWRVLKEQLLNPLLYGHGSKNTEMGEDYDAVETPIDKVWDSMNFALAAMFTYTDLKKHQFHYTLAFPVVDLGSPVYVKHRVKSGYAALATEYGALHFANRTAVDRVHAHLLDRLQRHPERGPNPFIVVRKGAAVNDESETVSFYPFAPTTIKQLSKSPFLVVMADVSTMEDFPGWSARNVVGALRLAHPSTTSFTLYCIRYNDVEQSVVFECTCDPLKLTLEDAVAGANAGEEIAPIRAVGWTERKSAASPVSSIDLGAMMDPERLAESSARLNLSLMKWRMLPDLRLDELAACKALVLGSGTLGCNVARHLLMWGVTKITLVDRGDVSFSNPVRQTLFEMSDVINPKAEERNKAVAAAKALKRVLPTVQACGVPLTIHMPGHRIDKQREAEAIAEIERLDALIQAHDVVFLLTDSREARWLPTVMATAHNKPLINAALGFDTYVVMRHGVEEKEGSAASRLGCYFCSDVVAPRDSVTARSLDQQCTVTRPGVSAIASATALELLAQLYNHPLGFACPPYTEAGVQQGQPRQDEGSPATPSTNVSGAACVLGKIPHQIRGSVFTHHIYTLYGYRYDLCTACSDAVVGAYRSEGASFVLRCVNDPLYIEEVCGVKAFKEGFKLDDLGEWDVESHSD